MSLLRELVERIDALVSGRAAPAEIKPLLASLEEHVEALEKQIEDLKSINAGLEEEAANFYSDVDSNPGKEDFVEHRGALFKRKPEGGYHLAVYCPSCRQSVGSLHDVMPYNCKKCKWVGDFTGNQLVLIMSELPP